MICGYLLAVIAETLYNFVVEVCHKGHKRQKDITEVFANFLHSIRYKQDGSLVEVETFAFEVVVVIKITDPAV